MERTLSSETLEKVGQKVKLLGWAATIRDHGKITFIDLRDRKGIIQCVGKDFPKITAESVIEVTGEVAKRPENLVNKNIPTGEVEVKVEKVTVLTKSTELPIPIEGEGLEIEEPARLKYRYLDLRRPRMSRNLRLRSRATMFIRNWLTERDFDEVETPFLTKPPP